MKRKVKPIKNVEIVHLRPLIDASEQIKAVFTDAFIDFAYDVYKLNHDFQCITPESFVYLLERIYGLYDKRDSRYERFEFAIQLKLALIKYHDVGEDPYDGAITRLYGLFEKMVNKYVYSVESEYDPKTIIAKSKLMDTLYVGTQRNRREKEITNIMQDAWMKQLDAMMLPAIYTEVNKEDKEDEDK